MTASYVMPWYNYANVAVEQGVVWNGSPQVRLACCQICGAFVDADYSYRHDDVHRQYQALDRVLDDCLDYMTELHDREQDQMEKAAIRSILESAARLAAV